MASLGRRIFKIHDKLNIRSSTFVQHPDPTISEDPKENFNSAAWSWSWFSSAVQWPGKLNQNQFHNDLIPCYPLSCRGNCFLVGGALCWPVGWLMTWMSIQVQGMITDQVRLMGDNSWPTQPGSSVIKMWGPGMCGMDLIEYWLN